MELKISTAELSKALGRSQGIVEKKSTMPILSHVLLEAKKDTLIVSATDLDLAVSSEHGEGCEVLKEGALAVSARHLFDIVERTIFAVSTDETRYNLNGVYFEPSAEALRLVATDGHRLALVERKVGANFGLKRGVILPKKGLQELKKLLAEAAEAGGEAGETKLGFVENSAIVRRPGVTLSMRLIEGL